MWTLYYVCMHVCIYVHMYVTNMNMCVCVCMLVCTCICSYIDLSYVHVCVYVCVHMWMVSWLHVYIWMDGWMHACSLLFAHATVTTWINVAEHPQGLYPQGESQAIFLHAQILEGLRRAVKQTVIHQVGPHILIHLLLLIHGHWRTMPGISVFMFIFQL